MATVKLPQLGHIKTSVLLTYLAVSAVTITTAHALSSSDFRSDCWRRQAGSRRNLYLETVRQEHGRLEHGDRTLPDPTSCADVNRHQGRHRRDAADLINGPQAETPLTSGRAVYFSGAPEVLQFKAVNANGSATAPAREPAQPFPRHQFTTALWVQPEGGQMQPVVLMGLYNKCASSFIWSLGMRAEPEITSVTSLSSSNSTVDGRAVPRSSSPINDYFRRGGATWRRSMTDNRLHLYVDGGRVATGKGQKGPLFSSATSSCVSLLLGGSRDDQKYFRGKVADLAVWGRALPHREVIEYMRASPQTQRRNESVHKETFQTLNNFVTLNDMPRVVSSDVTYRRHDMTLKPPPCGMTICDDPEVIRSYSRHRQLRNPKTVNYRIVNLANDDGTNPTVTPEQIKRQDRALRAAFSSHNITFRLVKHEVTNTSLRRRVILEKCLPEMVGDGVCNCACQHPSTGNDGGDCDDVTSVIQDFCTVERIGDNKCDDLCNIRYYNWDGGDCCTTGHSCRDPTSPHRAYMTLSEYKRLLALPADSHLNIFFANWTNPDLLGIATFPWDRNVHSVMGGVVMQPEVYGAVGRTDNLVHEIGHVLGLLHVHHGISGMDCSDPCLETEASMTLGDLCEDTRPTPVNGYCRDPIEGAEDGSCDLGPFTNTPYSNYMSYSDDECMNNFSPQQAARMHCYLDLFYQRWQLVPKPSPVPLPPRVVAATLDSVSLRWLPPVGSGRTAIDQICSECRADSSLVQFASAAWSDGARPGAVDWAPVQATGPPDARPCTQSTLAWRPELRPGASLMLEVSLKYPVVPRRLSIWVIFNASKNIKDIELVFKDGAVHRLGTVTAQCDSPFTTTLSMDKLLTKVRIHVWDPLVGVDALMVESEPGYTGCDVCPPTHYAISRLPPFKEGHIITHVPHLVDNDVLHPNTNTYTYHVEAILGSKRSGMSPPLVHTHGDPFCGDGTINSSTEECDDGNLLSGDGCDLSCKTEQLFRCHGNPSVCVHHIGDGVCEEFERRSSLIDCGFFTPEGATDQWAVSARAHPEFQTTSCPERAVIGPPDFDVAKTCQMPSFHPDLIWTPCAYSSTPSEFWLEASFARPVVATAVLVYAHLTHLKPAYGATYRQNTTLHLDLIDVNNVTHDSGRDIILTCDTQPLTFDIQHNLDRIFYFTKGVRLRFQSSRIGISGIMLRTRATVSHQVAASCTMEQLYNPNTGRCVPYSCERPLCETFVIKYANISCTGNRDGDRCRVKCLPGYQEMSGHTYAVCTAGTWTGAVRCEPLSCGPPTIPFARLDCPDGHIYGKKCKFECRRPARKIGTGNLIVCEDDGLWSLPEAFCEMRCAAPPVVKDASLTTSRCYNDQEVGARCRFKCTKGYHVVGEPNTKRVLRYTCSEVGSWVGRRCEPVHCPHIEHVLHGLYSCTQHFHAESTCTLKCPGPTRVTSSITCRQNGQWDAEFTRCKFEPGECPETTSNEHITVSCNTRNIGSKCNVSCNESGYEPVVSSHRHQGAAVSNHGNVLRHVTCTGQKLWYPDVDDVTCVAQCKQPQIGDGICQAPNNREHCRWDGGDCCASTAPGGVVTLADDNCTSDCRCQDLSASQQLPSDSRYLRGQHSSQNYLSYFKNFKEEVDYEEEEDNGTF